MEISCLHFSVVRYYDTFAAVNIVKTLNLLVEDLGVSVEELNEKAKEISKKADKKLAELMEESDEKKTLVSPGVSRMYI